MAAKKRGPVASPDITESADVVDAPVEIIDVSAPEEPVADAPEAQVTQSIYASAGEHLTCPNGHVIGTFNQDIASEDPMRAADIDWSGRNSSKPGHVVAPCAECGEHYLRVKDSGGTQAHIGEAWR